METYKVAVFSTAHITKKAADLLTDLAKNNNMVFSRDTGFFIKLYEELDYNKEFCVSPEITSIIKLTHKSGCRMIELDCDGPIYENLQTYDW